MNSIVNSVALVQVSGTWEYRRRHSLRAALSSTSPKSPVVSVSWPLNEPRRHSAVPCTQVTSAMLHTGPSLADNVIICFRVVLSTTEQAMMLCPFYQMDSRFFFLLPLWCLFLSFSFPLDMPPSIIPSGLDAVRQVCCRRSCTPPF